MKKFEVTTASGRKHIIEADVYLLDVDRDYVAFCVYKDGDETTRRRVASINNEFVEAIKEV